MRQSLGTAVFSGMIGVALFGIFLTPVFFFVLMWFSRHRQASTAASGSGDAGGTSLGRADTAPPRGASQGGVQEFAEHTAWDRHSRPRRGEMSPDHD